MGLGLESLVLEAHHRRATIHHFGGVFVLVLLGEQGAVIHSAIGRGQRRSHVVQITRRVQRVTRVRGRRRIEALAIGADEGQHRLLVVEMGEGQVGLHGARPLVRLFGARRQSGTGVVQTNVLEASDAIQLHVWQTVADSAANLSRVVRGIAGDIVVGPAHGRDIAELVRVGSMALNRSLIGGYGEDLGQLLFRVPVAAQTLSRSNPSATRRCASADRAVHRGPVVQIVVGNDALHSLALVGRAARRLGGRGAA